MVPKVDWSDWSFGPGRHPIMGAGMSGLTALSVTMVGHVTGLLPTAWPLVAGVILALAAAGLAAYRGMPAPVLAYRGLCWLAAGAWSSGTLAWSTPWSRWPLVVLATGVTLAGMAGSVMAWLEQRPKPETPSRFVPAIFRDDPLIEGWQVRLRKITRREVTVRDVDRWDPPTGHTLHVDLPADGTTVADIRSYEAQLAAAANLPPGCNVEVLNTDRGRRSCLIRVGTVNAMADTHHLPDDVSPLSIEDPLPIGIHADRTLATINLRYSCGVLVGQTDSGKSNTLNDITHQLVRCTDALVWAIDLSGNGRFPRPWIRAWREGQAPKPAIDWAAVTPEEAMRLTSAAINIINGRTAAYERLMFEQNTDKIPVSPQLPEIVILVDEFADLPDPIKEALETISNTGRGAAARTVSSVLRAIGQYISRAMIVQARERIAMRVSDEAELQNLFDAMWSRGRVDPASVPYQGSGLISTGTSPIMPFKAWRLEPARIDAAVRAVAPLRPELDAISVELAGKDYAGRWDRTLPLMFPATGASGPTPQQQAAVTGTTTVTMPRQEEHMNLEQSGEDLRRKVEAARAAAEQADAEHATEDGPEVDWSVVDGWLDEARPEDAEPRLLPRARMRQVVQEHRRDGVGPRVVWRKLRDEGYATTEPTVIEWMRADLAAGILAQPGGERTPYVPGPKFSLDQP